MSASAEWPGLSRPPGYLGMFDPIKVSAGESVHYEGLRMKTVYTRDEAGNYDDVLAISNPPYPGQPSRHAWPFWTAIEVADGEWQW